MIRRMREEDLDRVAGLWLDTNLKAHDFIPAQYWRGNFDAVRGMLLQAEVYVWEKDGAIQGFAGLDGSYIAGLFVADGAQSGGIGKRLIEFLKAEKPKLTLNVYRRNTRAVRFYQREGFQIAGEGTDEATGEAEYRMAWETKRAAAIKSGR